MLKSIMATRLAEVAVAEAAVAEVVVVEAEVEGVTGDLLSAMIRDSIIPEIGTISKIGLSMDLEGGIIETAII